MKHKLIVVAMLSLIMILGGCTADHTVIMDIALEKDHSGVFSLRTTVDLEKTGDYDSRQVQEKIVDVVEKTGLYNMEGVQTTSQDGKILFQYNESYTSLEGLMAILKRFDPDTPVLEVKQQETLPFYSIESISGLDVDVTKFTDPIYDKIVEEKIFGDESNQLKLRGTLILTSTLNGETQRVNKGDVLSLVVESPIGIKSITSDFTVRLEADSEFKLRVEAVEESRDFNEERTINFLRGLFEANEDETLTILADASSFTVQFTTPSLERLCAGFTSLAQSDCIIRVEDGEQSYTKSAHVNLRYRDTSDYVKLLSDSQNASISFSMEQYRPSAFNDKPMLDIVNEGIYIQDGQTLKTQSLNFSGQIGYEKDRDAEVRMLWIFGITGFVGVGTVVAVVIFWMRKHKRKVSASLANVKAKTTRLKTSIAKESKHLSHVRSSISIAAIKQFDWNAWKNTLIKNVKEVAMDSLTYEFAGIYLGISLALGYVSFVVLGMSSMGHLFGAPTSIYRLSFFGVALMSFAISNPISIILTLVSSATPNGKTYTLTSFVVWGIVLAITRKIVRSFNTNDEPKDRLFARGVLAILFIAGFFCVLSLTGIAKASFKFIGTDINVNYSILMILIRFIPLMFFALTLNVYGLDMLHAFSTATQKMIRRLFQKWFLFAAVIGMLWLYAFVKGAPMTSLALVPFYCISLFMSTLVIGFFGSVEFTYFTNILTINVWNQPVLIFISILMLFILFGDFITYKTDDTEDLKHALRFSITLLIGVALFNTVGQIKAGVMTMRFDWLSLVLVFLVLTTIGFVLLRFGVKSKILVGQSKRYEAHLLKYDVNVKRKAWRRAHEERMQKR